MWASLWWAKSLVSKGPKAEGEPRLMVGILDQGYLQMAQETKKKTNSRRLPLVDGIETIGKQIIKKSSRQFHPFSSFSLFEIYIKMTINWKVHPNRPQISRQKLKVSAPSTAASNPHPGECAWPRGCDSTHHRCPGKSPSSPWEICRWSLPIKIKGYINPQSPVY